MAVAGQRPLALTGLVSGLVLGLVSVLRAGHVGVTIILFESTSLGLSA